MTTDDSDRVGDREYPHEAQNPPSDTSLPVAMDFTNGAGGKGASISSANGVDGPSAHGSPTPLLRQSKMEHRLEPHLHGEFVAVHASASSEKQLSAPELIGSLPPAPSTQTTNIDLTSGDLERIWEWNSTVPAAVKQRVCDLIEKRAQAQPSAPAICAWDGELTHGELNQLATKLASKLIGLGIGPDTFVPLCFEKSMWTTVALVGVIKAGGAFVLLDPSLPEQRLQGIITQLNASVVLTSAANHEMTSRLAQIAIVLDWSFFAAIGFDGIEETNQQAKPNPASPESLLYAVFTSGSTGVPKGVLITNTNAASALHYQVKNMGISEHSRIFDFASYSFDVSVSNVLTALSAGGCLCVPSNEDRSNNLEQSIASLRATVLDITPSIAHVLSPDRIPTVKTLIFGGEALHLRDIEPWWGKVQIIHIYGPCECTPTSTINYDNDSAASPEEAVHIGKAVGLVSWIVDPEDHSILLPPGCAGELLLEGPLVGRGYLNDPAKTADAFIEDPVWLLRGSSSCPGRRGRLYKTGDLVRYTEEGYLQYVGRKQATQVKIRGQRLELGEIEHTLRNHACVDEAVAVLHREDGQESRIVSFVTLRDAAVEEQLEEGEEEVQQSLTNRLMWQQRRKAQGELYALLKSQLPAYMVPQAIEVLDSMPLNRSGKIDRQMLIQGLKGRRTRVRDADAVRQPTLEAQRQMLQIWARVLHIDASTIGLDDSFLHLGGSSISAMKLVTEARKMGMKLTVADIFGYPVLHELVNQIRHEPLVDQARHFIAPFALIDAGGDLGAVLADICSQYELGHMDNRINILDAYPCTPLQEGLMSLTSMSPGSYIGQNVLELSPGISVEKLRAAWEQAVHQLPILRTRIVQHDRIGLVQIVVDTPIHWIEADSLDDYLDSDIKQPMDLGQPLARYALVKDDTGTPKWFVWTTHHAIYDGWSMPLVLDVVNSIARDEPVEQGPQFQAFIKYVKEQDEETMKNYWRHAYRDCQCTPFPSLPPHIEQPTADGSIEHSFPLPQSNRLGVTPPIIIRAAWAFLVGRMNSTDDVVFGVTLFGRNAPVAGIEMMTGPTFATVPVRVKWDSSDRVAHYLNAVQEQATGMIAYEQIGLHRLAQVSPGARQACMFQTLLVVQPPDASGTSDVFGRWRNELDRGSRFDSYGLMLIAQLGVDQASVTATFDSRMIDPWLVDKLLRRLGHVVFQLVRASPELSLSEVETTTPEDLQQIWRWNHAVPAATEQCVHHMFEQTARSQPRAPAVYAWDGEWTYGQLDEVSTRLAHHLAGLGVGPGGLVPLCFEKSRWTPVVMLAVMKAGGASVAMDSTQPEERLRTVVQQTEPELVLVLSSSANRELASRLSSKPVVVVDESLLDTLSRTHAAGALLSVTPSDRLYVAFTSGSTGTPKGAVITHSNFSSAIQHVRASSVSRIEHTARVYDFVSYAFDISWFNVLQSLTNGACLCIPSEADRRDDLAGSIHRLRATFAILTPSTAGLLPSETVRQLQTLMLAGEALPSQSARRWAGWTQVRNGYGPCECTPITTAAAIDQDSVVASSIGKGVGVNTWVVQVSNDNHLAPIGDIGELVLEGPLVGSGYLGDAKKTAMAFIRDPAWLQRGAPGHSGRQGRLYKTGDLVRYSPDGSLVFVGRLDATQVKIRGQRVELGEVEHYVHACIPSARQVVAEVIMPTDGEGQERPTLAAFLLVDDKGGSSPVAEVMRIPADVDHEISKRLPVYMVPTAYFSLNNLPLNSSGKLDRRRLREIGSSFTLQQLVDLRNASSLSDNKRAPATETERVLQQIWARVLSIDAASIGADDSFLRLGGDSITAMQASAAARRFNMAISTADIMRSKTISMLAAAASASQHQLLNVGTAGADEDGQPFGLSPIQHLYVAIQPDPKWCFDQSFLLKPRERISLTSLAKAIATVVARHPMLRARFAQTSPGRWKQRVVDDIHTSFHLCQVLGTASTNRSTRAGDMRRCRERLNIQTGPLLAAVLFDDAKGQSLFIAAHHLVIDLVSWRILLEEFEVLLTGHQLPPVPTTSFRTWCSLQAQYVAEYLDAKEAASSPVRPPSSSSSSSSSSSYWGLDMRENIHGATASRQFVLDEASSAAIMGACNEAFGTRPVELMIAALVHSFSVVFVDRPPPTVFNEGHGREPWDDRIDLSRTVGWFTTIFPACTSSRTTAVELLDAVRHAKDSVRSLPKNGWSYFTSKFADETKAATSAAGFPVEVLLNFAGSYQQLERDGSFFENLSTAECPSPESWSKLRRLALFEFNGHMDKGRLAMSLDYPSGVHHSDLIEAWMDTYEATLTHLSTLLKDRPSEWILSDFPMAFTSYADIHEFQSVVMPQLGITSLQEIEDIYPCSGLQEGLLVAQGKSPSDYRIMLRFEIAATEARGDCVDLARIERAWGAVVRRHALLRAVLVDIMPGTSRTMHVILKDSTPSISYDSGLNGDHEVGLKYGKYDPQHHLSLSRIDEKHVHLCFELSHAILDGHSTGVLLHDFWQAYDRPITSDGPLYSEFIRYVETRPRDADREFWINYLDGVQPCLFPGPEAEAREQTRDFIVAVPGLDASGIHDFCSKWEVTTASVIQTAWALVLHHYTGSASPCFGNLASGRHVPVDGVGDMFGPVIGMIPYRVHIRGDQSVIATLREVQTDFVNSLLHQTPLMEIHEALQVGSSGLFNSILSFQRDIKQPSQSADGHTIQERGGYDPVEYPISLSVRDNGRDVSIEMSFKRGFMASDEAERVARALGATVLSLVSNPDQKVSSVNLLARVDLEQLWAWNSEVPGAEETLVHTLVEEQARRRPDAAAVSAWDGELTYKELDRLADRLAQHLASMRVGPGALVPLCFEKSVWTPVAALGVLKAGAGFALLSPSLPEQRLQSIVQQLEAGVILSSSSNLDLSSRLLQTVVQVGPESPGVPEHTTTEEQTPRTETSSAPMYAVFTSGSTGTPKGVVLSHRNFCSALRHQSHLLGFNERSRVFDFASYAFDISVHNIFATLAIGGCLCIPAEKDLRDNVSGSMADFKATLVDLTPSVARLIDPATVPEIETIILAGEAVSIDDAKRWWGKARLVNAYGPAECNFSTINWQQSCAQEATLIGKGAGIVTWVVDPENHDLLLPPGCIGELLVEGPVVGLGYLGDKGKTDAAFIEDPAWLLAGSPGKHSGRHGRLYKTGDLVRYNPDGNMVFSGRKQDTQVKIRGQRVELAEVQHWVQKYMPEATHVVADVIQLQGDTSLLVIFLQLNDRPTERDELGATVKVLPVPPEVEGKLAEHLPAYMIPSVLFSLSRLPMTATGKTDRRRLRHIGAQFTIEQLAEVRTAGRGPKRQPTCEAERMMQNIWAKVLDIGADTIGLDDSFFRLGGDSISCMRLVSEARKLRMNVTVADVFRHETLAALVRGQDLDRTETVGEPDEAMLVDSCTRRALLEEVDCMDLGLRSEDVADIWPVTSVQERCFLEGIYPVACVKEHSAVDATTCGRFANYMYLDLDADADASLLEEACSQTLDKFPILRACFLWLQGKLWQVVLNQITQPFRVQDTSEDLDVALRDFCLGDAHTVSPTQPPLAVVLLRRKGHGMRLVIRISHAQYDGICLPTIVQSFMGGNNVANPAPPTFSTFLSYASRRRSQSLSYWTELLRGSQPNGLRKQLLAQRALEKPQLKAIHLRAETKLPRLPNKITPATLASAAWALLLSRLTGQDDVVYGHLVAGRNSAIPGVEEIVGCCLDYIPVRVKQLTSSSQTPAGLLRSVQEQFLAVGEADSLGYKEIIQNCTAWPASTGSAFFESTIQHQNIDEHPDIRVPGGGTSRVQFFQNPHLVPMSIHMVSYTQGERFFLELASNTHIMAVETARAMVDGMVRIVRKLDTDMSTPLSSWTKDICLVD